jgi:hypothetical protein
MNSITLLRIFVHIFKVLCHVTIIGMASICITCLALFPGPTNGFMVVQYILNIMVIAANLYPCGGYALPHPHAAWLGINLLFTLLNWQKKYTDTIHGLLDNDVILNYLNPGQMERHRVLFWASVASWLIILALHLASLGLAKFLEILEEVEKAGERRNIVIAILKKLLELMEKYRKKTPEIDLIV